MTDATVGILSGADAAAGADAGAHRPTLRERVGGIRLAGLGSALIGLVCLAPLGFLLVHSFIVSQVGTPTRYGVGNWTTAFTSQGTVTSMVHTVELVAVRVGIALPVGIALSWLVARTNMPGRRVVEFAAWIGIFTPILPMALGWTLLLDPQSGFINTTLAHLFGTQHGPFTINGFWGITWVYIATNSVAYPIILLTPAFRRMGAALEESARICGAGTRRTMLRITLPLMAPTILLVGVLAIVFSMQSFQVELLLGEPVRYYVFSTQIYNLMTNVPSDEGQAAALASVFLFVLIVLSVLYRRYLSKRNFTVVSGSSYGAPPLDLRRWRWPAAVVSVGFFVVALAVPFVFLVIGSFMRLYGFFGVSHPFTLAHWSATIHDPQFSVSVRNSLIIGAATAVFTILVYMVVAHSIVRNRTVFTRAADQLVWAPVAAPGILMSLGLLQAFLATPLRTVLYGNVIGLIVAYVIHHSPLSTQLFKASLLQLGSDLEEGSKICGASRLRTYAKIIAPLLAPTAVTVGLLTFLVTLQDIPTAVLLYSPKSEPLPIMMLNYSTSGALEQASVLGVLTVAFALTLLIVSRLFGYRLSRESV